MSKSGAVDPVTEDAATAPPAEPVSPAAIALGAETITRWQQAMGSPADGVLTSPRSPLVEAVQSHLNVYGNSLKVDGDLGPSTVRALRRYLGLPQDGDLDSAVVELRHRLNVGRF